MLNCRVGFIPLLLLVWSPFADVDTGLRTRTSTNLPAQEIQEEQSSDWTIRCLDGMESKPFADRPATKAMVLIFISIDCPIANGYLPQLHQLAREYEVRGVRMFLVHSCSDLDHGAANAHAEEYGISIPIVLDATQAIARRVGAKVTPEAVVIAPDSPEPVYRGAIDNLHADYGKKRRVASERYLTNALDEVLDGKRVTRPRTKPVGCFIAFD